MEADLIQAAGAAAVAASVPRQTREPTSAPTQSAPESAPQTDTVTVSQAGKEALQQAQAVDAPVAAQENQQETPAAKEQSSTQLKFEVKDKQVVLKVVDGDTGEVVREIPPQEQQRLSQAIQDSVGKMAGRVAVE